LTNKVKLELKKRWVLISGQRGEEAALAQVQWVDCKLMLVSNMADLLPAEIVQLY